MIIGLGIDLIELKRIKRAWERFETRFARRILTKNELSILPPDPVLFLASRFSGKEAAVKALGTGFSQSIGFSCLEIMNNPQGKPVLNLLGPARDLAHKLGAKRNLISLTHSKDQAAAVVIIEG